MKKWKCTICNYIHTGDEPPEICPVCGADKSYFVEVTDEVEQSAEAVDLEKDRTGRTEISSGQKWKCTVCSYIHPEEELPELCPQCAAGKNFFVKVPVEKEIEPVKEEKAEAKREEKPPVSEQPEQFGLAGRLIVRHHLHPISVHTPNGVYPVAIILLVLAVVFGSEVLEKASYFNFIAVFLSMPVVFFTGLVAWKLKYRAAKTWIFRTKLVCGALVTVFVSLLVFWRFIDNGIAFSEGVGGSIYLGLSLVTLATIGLAGHLGGKLVFNK